MQARKQTQPDEFARFAARIHDLLGTDPHTSGAATRYPFSKTTRSRSNHAGEVRRGAVSPSPRMWNETLAFATDG